jgi:hypothetical protein
MLERRSTLRCRMIRSMGLHVGQIITQCTALDVSAAGARVYLANPALLTQIELWRVALRLPDGTERVGRRIWQSGNELGFEFFPFVTNEMAPGPPDVAGEPDFSAKKDLCKRDRITHLARVDIARAWNVDVSQVRIEIIPVL